MSRQIKPSVGPFKTKSLSFQKGKERPIEITLYPEYIEVRAVGIPERYHVTWGAILRVGAEQEVNHRIKRGIL